MLKHFQRLFSRNNLFIYSYLTALLCPSPSQSFSFTPPHLLSCLAPAMTSLISTLHPSLLSLSSSPSRFPSQFPPAAVLSLHHIPSSSLLFLDYDGHRLTLPAWKIKVKTEMSEHKEKERKRTRKTE